MPDKISVMLVDDSAVIRAALSRLLKDVEAIDIVASIGNGQVAIEQAASRKPDIVILDVEMPVMGGLDALPHILKASPSSKVFMFSTLTAKGADTTLKAFTLGAVECLLKPTSAPGANDQEALKDRLLQLIKSLYRKKYDAFYAPSTSVTLKERPSAQQTTATQPSPFKQDNKFSLLSDPMAYKGKPSVIAIGSSTGGPNALFEVCQHLKGLSMPVVITQHMPATFTKILAEHITEKSGLPTCEASEGMAIEPGRGYVAPGGFHMVFRREGTTLRARLKDTEPVNFCKPAVDPMFESLVSIFGSRILGVVLTGMGSDGLGGGKAIIEAKGRLIAQDEASSTVWGMPRAVAMAGICEAVLPLNEIGPWIKTKAT